MRRLLALLIPLAGCTSAVYSTSSSVASPRAPSAGGGDTELRRVFVAGLTSPAGGSTSNGHAAARSFARGRAMVEIRPDSSVQYRLDISNPAAEVFTGATVHRRVANGVGPAVIALFADATINEREIEVRGTGVVLDPKGWSAVEELRSSPGSFVIVVRSRRVVGASLTGTIE
jgi:hypothetical protein